MNVKFLFKAAGIVLVIHGIIELLGILSMVTGQAPHFIFREIEENWQQALFIGIISGVIRIVAAISIFKRMKWGVILGLVMSAITLSSLTLYLPFGMADELLAGIVLVLLVMAYWGKEKIGE